MEKKGKGAKITISLPSELYLRVRAHKEKFGLSISQICREALEQAMERAEAWSQVTTA